MRKIKEIIVHCSATAEGKDFCAKDIDLWHRAQGWDCIGYHYVVKLDSRKPPCALSSHGSKRNTQLRGFTGIAISRQKPAPRSMRKPNIPTYETLHSDSNLCPAAHLLPNTYFCSFRE